jgi:hypothetical protein
MLLRPAFQAGFRRQLTARLGYEPASAMPKCEPVVRHPCKSRIAASAKLVDAVTDERPIHPSDSSKGVEARTSAWRLVRRSIEPEQSLGPQPKGIEDLVDRLRDITFFLRLQYG